MTIGSFSLDFLKTPANWTPLQFLGIAFVVVFIVMTWAHHVNGALLGD